MAGQTVIVSGLPYDNAENRARVAELGVSVPTWPAPYKNSLQTACEDCGAAMWLGPETHTMYLNLIARGDTPLVLCLLCCALLAKNGVDVGIVTLTGKDSAKGE